MILLLRYPLMRNDIVRHKLSKLKLTGMKKCYLYISDSVNEVAFTNHYLDQSRDSFLLFFSVKEYYKNLLRQFSISVLRYSLKTTLTRNNLVTFWLLLRRYRIEFEALWKEMEAELKASFDSFEDVLYDLVYALLELDYFLLGWTQMIKSKSKWEDSFNDGITRVLKEIEFTIKQFSTALHGIESHTRSMITGCETDTIIGDS